MTKLLEKAAAKARELPEAEQDAIAQIFRNSHKKWPLLCALLALVMAASCPAQITAQRMAAVPQGVLQYSSVTDDGQHAALAIEADGLATIVVDDKVMHPNGTVPYDAISLGAGGRFAYPEQINGKWRVITDSGTGPIFDEIMGHLHDRDMDNNSILFSRDGKHFAYAGKRDSQWTLVFDGKEGPTFREIIEAAFSPDGSHFAYIATRENHSAPKQWIITQDGKEIGSYASPISHLVFSADGKRLAWIAGIEGSEWMVIDGHFEPAYFNVKPACFSADGKRVAYIAWPTQSHSIVVIDGKEDLPILGGGPGEESKISAGPVFSADSKHIVYAINEPLPWPEEQNPYVIDGQVHPAGLNERGLRETISSLMFMPSGAVAYVGSKSGGGPQRGEVRMVIAGKADDWVRWLWFPALSPDGKRIAYVATPFAFPMIPGQMDIESYRTVADYEEMCVDGIPGPQYDVLLAPIFSADSKHVAYGGAKKDMAWSILLDGREVGKYELVIRTLNGNPILSAIPGRTQIPYAFDENNSLRFMGISNGALYRVRVSP